MPIELKIPEIGESITEVEIGGWLKNKGDAIKKDEPLVTVESEKATVELPAPESGVVGEILKQKGETAKVGELIGYLEKDGAGEGERSEVRGERSEAIRKEATPKPASKSPGSPAAEAKPEKQASVG